MILTWRALAIWGALYACRGADTLDLTLATDKASYHAGEPIELILKLTNRSKQAIALEFSSSQRYDFEIADSSGTKVWQWSADRMFAQMLGTERLAPGESREYRERVSGSLAPGTYRVTGRITATDSTAEGTATLTVH
jgi:hypothetical protein